MRVLYPATRPFVRHTLAVDSPHELHIEECGRPGGIPAVFLHGGPGGGCEPFHRRFFDPDRYRLVLFDQRGSGRSSPHAALEGNHTQALVADLERIRVHLEIERWLVFGGSWGATLALSYAEAYPERVTGLILRGVFLGTQAEIDWFYRGGAARFFPEAWADFLAPLAESRRSDPVAAFYELLTSDDELCRMAAAKAWATWEGRCATLRSDEAVVAHFGDPYVALALARIECHYFKHACFLEPDQLLRDAGRLRAIPGVIVQGRYDMVCPPRAAHELHKAWPGSSLEVVPDAGHAASEPGVTDALLRATDRFAEALA